ncbi:MAG TPA: PLP-dependent aminotransferase family protein [Jatrophihabitans sp.]|jgi:GntR family transcriptional regulator/MocR family aminotransferase|nr:PLP-dependent aminotransferase family protein [Jatrophihabitans sp.]
MPIDIDRAAPRPIHRQIYEWLRTAILGGDLASGIRLPPTRQLAAQLGVARSTVTAAYEQLIADGYLDARVGAWTSVARSLPADVTVAARPDRTYGASASPVLNRAARWVEEWARTVDEPMRVEFRHRLNRALTPAVDAFPVDEWRRLVVDYWRTANRASLIDFSPAGDLDLRREIMHFVRTTRGIECGIGQIIITNGMEQAIDNLARILLEPGDRVAIEDPTPTRFRNLFRSHGAKVVPVPVDADGLRVDVLTSLRGPAPALVYLTPTHQVPTGAVLSLRRRLDLLRWAAEQRTLLIEDDYDSELTYEGGVIEALQALDKAGVVAYVGTFTKVLNPAIQIGYLIVPAPLVHAVAAIQRMTARPTEVSHQAVLARFIAEGGMARHLRRLRRVHLIRRDAMLDALQREFGDDVDVGPARSGLQLHVRWRNVRFTDEVITSVLESGVGVLPVRPMYMVAPHRDPGLVLAYASCTPNEIYKGVRALAEVLDRCTGADRSRPVASVASG